MNWTYKCEVRDLSKNHFVALNELLEKILTNQDAFEEYRAYFKLANLEDFKSLFYVANIQSRMLAKEKAEITVNELKNLYTKLVKASSLFDTGMPNIMIRMYNKLVIAQYELIQFVDEIWGLDLTKE